MSISTVTLANNQVGKVGYGLMQLTWNPQPPAEDVSFAAMKAAADAGATAWSTATFYGNPGTPDANLALIGKFFTKYPEYKDKITIVLKGGARPDLTYTGDLDYNRESILHATELMGKKPEVYSYSRLPKDTPFEQLFQNAKTLRDEGLFAAVGVSEMNAESLERAHKIVPIAIIEIEISLWAYETTTKDVISWSKSNSVPIFAYSPLGRGFITRKWKSPADIPEGSFQKMLPRFQGEAFDENLKLVDRLDEIAEKRGLETGQLALAWVGGLSDQIIPIPGSSSVERVKKNTESANIKLSAEDNKSIDEILAKFEVKGGRYMSAMDDYLMK